MKILYVSTSFFLNTSAAIRNISLVNGLIENGHEVKIITLDYLEEFEDSYLKKEISQNIKIKKIEIPILNTLKLKTNNQFLKKETNNKYIEKIFFFLKNLCFFPDNCREAIKNINKLHLDSDFDLIISSSDSKTSHYLGMKLKEKYKKRWVQIWGDPWQEDINLKKLGKFNLLRIKKAEEKLIKKADKVFYISELTLKNMQKKYPIIKQKMDFIFRGFLKEILSEEYQNIKKEIKFTYTGSGIGRNFLPLLEKIKSYNKNNTKKIIFEIYGSYINDYKYDFLKVYKQVPYEKIEQIYRETDVLVYIDNIGETTQIPGKIYDYCGTDKNILALVENENTKEYLEKFKRMTIYNNSDEEIRLDLFLKNLSKQKIMQEFSPQKIAEDLIIKINKEKSK